MIEFSSRVQRGQNVLDLGCGNGRLLGALPSPINYMGLDLSEKLIEQARLKHLTHPSQPQFLVGDMRELPFSDASFHHVFLISSLYHIPGAQERQRVIHEIARVLKPGGYVYMTNWDLRKMVFWKPFFASLPHVLNGKLDLFDMFIPWKNSHGQIVVRRFAHAFSHAELARLLRRAGLTVELQGKTSSLSSQLHRAGNLITIAQKISKEEIPQPIPMTEPV